METIEPTAYWKGWKDGYAAALQARALMDTAAKLGIKPVAKKGDVPA
jgi:hypothetical protein